VVLLKLNNVGKSFGSGEAQTVALDGIDLELKQVASVPAIHSETRRV
jgi:hypothetical protein